jgi:hypothetical protein
MVISLQQNCHLDRSVAQWRDLRFFFRVIFQSEAGSGRVIVGCARRFRPTYAVRTWGTGPITSNWLCDVRSTLRMFKYP